MLEIAHFPDQFEGIGFDVKGATLTSANPVQRHKTEGGYSYTRPRYTRRPADTLTLSCVALTGADVERLQRFWELTRGRSLAFKWTNPLSSKVESFRFANEKLTFTYTGVGDHRRWDTQIMLEQVVGGEASFAYVNK